MGDDIGHHDIGYHGSADAITPNMDTLAADGIILNSYYTSPLCSPSRTAFLSGVHPIRSGEQHYVIENGEPRGFSLDYQLLPQHLKNLANYSTHLIGKWNLGFYRQLYTPLYRGFDTFFGYYGSKIDYFSHQSEFNDMIGLDFRYNSVPARNSKGYSTHLFTERAIQLIQGHNESHQPLYLHVAYQNTHCANSNEPLQAPDEYVRKFDFLPTRQRQVYAANLFTMDESIGLIFKALHQADLLSNTIILFASDNGAGDRGVFPNAGSNWPLRGVKGTLWEGSLRVPAFVWSPLLNQSSSANIFPGLFHVTDWVATLTEAVHEHIRVNETADTTARPEVQPDEYVSGRSQWQSIKKLGQEDQD